MKITLVPYAGLCNRMNVIISALAYQQNHPDVQLIIKWHRWFHCNCRFKDLFKPVTLIPSPYHVIELSELNWKDVPGHRLNLHLPDKLRKYFYDVVFMPHNSPDEFEGIVSIFRKTRGKEPNVYIYKENCFCRDSWMGNLADIFQPQEDIQRRIDEITKDWDGHVIGLHVRRTDNVLAIQNSPIERYYQIIEKEVELDSKVRFYLATDSEEVKHDLTSRFGKRIIAIPLCLKRSSLQGMKDAVVDLYCLASTSRIYGSSASTYSLLAGKIYGIPVIVETK